MNQGTGKGQFLLHASGQGGGQSGAKGFQPGESQEFLSMLLEVLHPVEVGEKLDVFVHRQISIEGKRLGEVSDPGLDGLRLAAEIEAKDMSVACRGGEDSA